MAVIGITSARSGDWKRGVAANVAARLAADGACSVAVVDCDSAGRDIGDRLGVETHACVEWPPLTVVPACAMVDLRAARTSIERVAATHDLVVVDLPLGAGAPGPALDAELLAPIDRLVVATDLSSSALRATARWVELVEIAQQSGGIPDQVEIVIAVVGESVGTTSERLVLAAMLGAAVVAGVPQYWGRTPPNFGFGPTLGFPELDDALRAVGCVQRGGYAANPDHACSASGHKRSIAHRAVASVK